MNAALDLLGPHLGLRPDKTACLWSGRSLTFRELAGRAGACARLLDQAGVGPGERAVLALPDGPAFLAAFLGAMLRGVLPVPANVLFGRDHFDLLLEDVGACALLAAPGHPALEAGPGLRLRLALDDGLLDGLGPAPLAPAFEADPAAPAFLLCTSGSTGRPKGVPHRGSHLAAVADGYARQVLGLTEDDLLFSTSKMSHAYGLGNSLAFPLALGATALLNPARTDPAEVLDLLLAHRPTAFFSVPTLYALLAQDPRTGPELGFLRRCVSAGEALPASVADLWTRRTGLSILDSLGATETVNAFLATRPGEARPGIVGRPVPGYEVRLEDEEGRPAQPGRPGRLLVRGPSVAGGYWNRPEATAEAMRPGGWWSGGDLFAEEEDGFRFLGRSDDLIKVGGNKVAPLLVEEVLSRHPDVAECAVTACRVSGLAQVKALVVLRPGAERSGIRASLRRHMEAALPEHMCPALFALAEGLPRTAAGKLDRKALREPD